MKIHRGLSILHLAVKAILVFHLLFLIWLIFILKSTWNKTEIGPEDWKGATNLYYYSGLGYLDIDFEFMYNDSNYVNGKHFYRTGNGYLKLIDNNANMAESIVSIDNETVNVPFTKLPLVIPVSPAQKRNLIFLASAYSILLLTYSMLIFFQLFRYIKSLIARNSISTSNLNLLYSIGMLVILLPLIKYVLQYIEITWIRNNFSFDEYTIVSNFPFQLTLFGLGILILAITETMRQSIKLKKEQELTI